MLCGLLEQQRALGLCWTALYDDFSVLGKSCCIVLLRLVNFCFVFWALTSQTQTRERKRFLLGVTSRCLGWWLIQ